MILNRTGFGLWMRTQACQFICRTIFLASVPTLSRREQMSSRVFHHTRTRECPLTRVPGDTCTPAPSHVSRSIRAIWWPPPHLHYQDSRKRKWMSLSRDLCKTSSCSSHPLPTHIGGSAGFHAPESQMAFHVIYFQLFNVLLLWFFFKIFVVQSKRISPGLSPQERILCSTCILFFFLFSWIINNIFKEGFHLNESSKRN